MSRLKKITGGVAVVTTAGALAIANVGGFEGLRTYAYQDVVGVWTACYGETKGIRPGMKFSKEDCNNMLVDSLVEHETGMRKCMSAPDAISDKTYVAFLSFTYNVGVGAFCKSTLHRKLNAGDVRGACDELLKWNRAGGRVVKGLTIRRAKERALCLEGVN